VTSVTWYADAVYRAAISWARFAACRSREFLGTSASDYTCIRVFQEGGLGDAVLTLPLLETPEFPYKERKKAFTLAEKIEKLIKRRYILRNYKGSRIIGYLLARLSTNYLSIILYERIRVIRFLGLRIRRLVLS